MFQYLAAFAVRLRLITIRLCVLLLEWIQQFLLFCGKQLKAWSIFLDQLFRKLVVRTIWLAFHFGSFLLIVIPVISPLVWWYFYGHTVALVLGLLSVTLVICGLFSVYKEPMDVETPLDEDLAKWENSNLFWVLRLVVIGGLVFYLVPWSSVYEGTSHVTRWLRPCYLTVDGHTESVEAISFHPDGKIAVSVSWDDTIKLWDCETGECLRTLNDHSSAVFSVAFHPNKKILATGSWDASVKIWDIETGKCLRTLKPNHEGGVQHLAFHPDGEMIAAVSGGTTIKLWDIESGECSWTKEGHVNVETVVFHPNGNVLVTGNSSDKLIDFWDTETGECLRTLENNDEGGVCHLAFHSNGKLLAAVRCSSAIDFWDTETGNLVRTEEPFTDSMYSLSFHFDANILVMANKEGTVKLWNTKNREYQQTFEGHNRFVDAADFYPASKILVSSSEKLIKFWHVR